MKLCKNAAEMTLFRRTLLSIFNLATFLTSSSISSWSMSVWQEAETDFFLPCLCFFQLAKNWLCCPYTEKYSRDPSKRHQTTHGLFAGNFRPLSPLKFLFPLSDIILLIHSDLLWLNIVGNAPFTTFFILQKVFTMSLVSKCWEHMCRSR